MTAKENGRNISREKQHKSHKTKVKKRKQRAMLITYVATLVACSLYAFLLGKSVGAGEALGSQRDENFLAGKADTEMVTEEGAYAPFATAEPEKGEGTVTGNYGSALLLVNKENPLPDDYEVELLTLPDGVNRASKIAYQPLCDMLEAGRREGLYFEICSSYRDVERQRELFEEDLRALLDRGYTYQTAYEEVAKETMPPGYSEHSTGLAFDIVAADYQMLDDGQERTAENKWLLEHCAQYGFILRYPEGKEDITSISHESWHFRYVGTEAAEYIMENNLTLEEFLEQTL